MGLCWIDDDTGSILELANCVLSKFWRDFEKLDVDIKLFGDEYMSDISESEKDETDIEIVKEKIRNKFREVCFSIDRENWKPRGETYREKKSKMPITCKGISCHSEETNKLLAPWRTDTVSPVDTNYDYKIYTKYNAQCDALIEMLNIRENDVVALDICLLHRDIDRCRNRLPLLSMALYHQLKQRNHKCFLYSRMSVNYGKKQNWKEVYQLIYETDEEIEIHSRFELCVDKNSPAFEDLRKMIS